MLKYRRVLKRLFFNKDTIPTKEKQLKIRLKIGLKLPNFLCWLAKVSKKYPFSGNLIKAGLFLIAFSLIFGNSYLSPKIAITQMGGGEDESIIKEAGLMGKINPESNFFTKTACAYYENTAVDGLIVDWETLIQNNSSFLEEFFVIIDSNNLMAVNSPIQLYLNQAKRHGTIVYNVKEGDTMGKIASDFGVSLNTILWANNLKSGSVIKPGQELIILPVSGVRHFVKEGETIVSIARKYKVSQDEIKEFNNIKDENALAAGQELIIPNGQLPTAVSLASAYGLKPMSIDITHWQRIDGFFTYPTDGGWNKGVLHYYNAVDIINTCGSPIYAAAEGIVSETRGDNRYNAGYGNLVKIQHYNGTATVYAHLGDVLVKEEDKINQGKLIGRMGDTGNANGCHLHFEVRGAQNPFVIKR